MADPVLHIKDAYFFEVPKFLWKRDFKSKDDVYKVSPVWVELDDQFQDWEFHRQHHKLTGKDEFGIALPAEETAHSDWHEWTHKGDNFGKPFDEFLASKVATREAEFQAWKKAEVAKAKDAEERRDANELDYGDYKSSAEYHADSYDPFVEKMLLDSKFQDEWKAATNELADIKEFVEKGPEWDADKLEGYSRHLSGKILIPQPFGKLRNLHEADSGFTITKYMIVEVGVALILAILFSWLARRVITGGAPKGRLWNLLETFVLFIRDQVAEPAIGGGHDDHGDGHGHGHDAHGKDGHHVDASGHAVANAAHAHGHDDHGHGHAPKKKHAVHVSPARKFTPLLCSIFFFVLGCNLAGMLPWIGSPTAVFGVTLAMALVTLTTVFVAGMIQFGFFGFFANQIPSMDMPWYMAIVMKPAIFVIEFGGLLIKHGVLAVRLLANMLAGHLVLLAIMGMAFGATAASTFIQANGEVGIGWWITATIAVIGCALLSILELFVAFLQAFVFTMLSALFIGAAVHKH
jgi:F-type H+-transporting ATPase subunit a